MKSDEVTETQNRVITQSGPVPDVGRNGKVATEIDFAIRTPVYFANLPVLPIAVYSLAELDTMESCALKVLTRESKRCTICIRFKNPANQR